MMVVPKISNLGSVGIFIVHRRILTLLIVAAGLFAFAFSGGLLGQAPRAVLIERLRDMGPALFVWPWLLIWASLLLSSFAPPLQMGRLLLSVALVAFVGFYMGFADGHVWSLLRYPDLIIALLGTLVLINLVPFLGRRHLQMMLLVPISGMIVGFFTIARPLLLSQWRDEEVAIVYGGVFLLAITLGGQLIYRLNFYLWEGASMTRAVAQAVNVSLASLILAVLAFGLQGLMIPQIDFVGSVFLIPIMAVVGVISMAALLGFVDQDLGLSRLEQQRHRASVRTWREVSARVRHPAAQAIVTIAAMIGFVGVWVTPLGQLSGYEVPFWLFLFSLVAIGSGLLLTFISVRIALLSLFIVGLGDLVATRFDLVLSEPLLLILVRTLLLILVAGAGLTWRSRLRGVGAGRLRGVIAIASAMAPFIATLCLVIIAAAGLSLGLRYGADLAPAQGQMVIAMLRLVTSGVVAIFLMPFVMMVLEKLRIL